MRAAEYIPLALAVALPGVKAEPVRFGGISVVSQSYADTGELDGFTTTRNTSPPLTVEDPLVRWTIEQHNRPDTLDHDVLNISGQVYVTVECYSPLYPSACLMVDDVLAQFNRDGVLSQIIAQHDEEAVPGRPSELYLHVLTCAIQGGNLQQPIPPPPPPNPNP